MIDMAHGTRFGAAFIALCFSFSVRGDVELQTSINDVYYRGTHELAGSITMTVTSDDFSGVSEDEPVFIQISLDDGATLADTLVDGTDPQAEVGSPLFLAMKLYGEDEDAELLAPPESVAIVRWVAGEASFWLRVQSDSGAWIKTGADQVRSPGEDLTVSWTLGVSARTSVRLVGDQKSNLPFNTRNPESTEPAFAESTLLCVDFSQSSIETTGSSSLLHWEPMTFQADAETMPGVFQPGAPFQLNIVGEFSLARGKDRRLVVRELPGSAQTMRVQADGDYLSLSNRFALFVDFERDFGLLETPLFDQWQLSFETTGSFGFEEDAVQQVGECASATVSAVDSNSAFELGDRTLFRKLEVVRSGGNQAFLNTHLEAEITLKVPVGASEHHPDVSWQLVLPNYVGYLDDAPYDGFHQRRRCPPSTFAAQSGRWRPVVAGNRTATLPHLTRTDGEFQSRIHLANPGDEAAPYFLLGYDEAGLLRTTVANWLSPRFRGDFNPEELFGHNAVSHFEITSTPGMQTGVFYRAIGLNKVQALVQATSRTAKRWVVHSGDPELTYDAMALVNMAAEPAHVTLIQRDVSGLEIDRVEITNPVASKEKLLVVLSQQFEPSAGASFEVVSSRDVAVISLRGDWASDLLWQTPSVPL